MKKQIISLFLVLSVLFMFSCKKDKENTKCSEENIENALNRWIQAASKASDSEKACEEFKSAAIHFFNITRNCSGAYKDRITEKQLDEIRNIDCSLVVE